MGSVRPGYIFALLYCISESIAIDRCTCVIVDTDAICVSVVCKPFFHQCDEIRLAAGDVLTYGISAVRNAVKVVRNSLP